MKKVGILLVSGAALMMFLTLAAIGARAESQFSSQFAGTFTLPFVAQWGRMTLPPGQYKLNYEMHNKDRTYLVEIRGEGNLPHGIVFVQGRSDAQGTENSIVCVLKGNTGYVRTLESPAIGDTVYFALP